MCEVIVKLLCKEAGGAGGGEGARDTESKTRTPHKVVGNNKHAKKLRPNKGNNKMNILKANIPRIPMAPVPPGVVPMLERWDTAAND